MAIIKLQYEPIDTDFYYQLLKDPHYGGIVSFAGTVREWTEGVQTKSIEYTAYEEMAVKELEKLAAVIEQKGAKVVIVHRLGKLALMDEAVFVGVATPHRQEAFAGCTYIMEQLKKKVPIWKKEIDSDSVRWGGIKDAEEG